MSIPGRSSPATHSSAGPPDTPGPNRPPVVGIVGISLQAHRIEDRSSGSTRGRGLQGDHPMAELVRNDRRTKQAAMAGFLIAATLVAGIIGGVVGSRPARGPARHPPQAAPAAPKAGPTP